MGHAPRAPRAVAALLVGLLVGGCDPLLDEEQRIADLRVLAVQVTPDVGALGRDPGAPVVRALVVDPLDPDGDDLTHTWAPELGDEDFEGRDDVESLVPEGPHGPSITLDFGAFGGRDGEWEDFALPLRYTVANGDLTREAIRVARFLAPPEDVPFPEWPDPELHPEYNANPTIDVIERLSPDGDEVLRRWAEPPGPSAALWMGEVGDEGLRFRVSLSDDGPAGDLVVSLLWTVGHAGLPDADGVLEDDGDGRAPLGDGVSPVLDNLQDPREFGWTPPRDEDEVVPRLFLVVRDPDGGQTWQELRPHAATRP